MLWIEGRVTLIDGILATAVLADLVLNAALGGVSWGRMKHRLHRG